MDYSLSSIIIITHLHFYLHCIDLKIKTRRACLFQRQLHSTEKKALKTSDILEIPDDRKDIFVLIKGIPIPNKLTPLEYFEIHVAPKSVDKYILLAVAAV